MSEQCKWLHRLLEQLAEVKYPFDIKKLPENGIYFFYEKGESWGHGGDSPKIVRIGTHRNGNFRSRISEHFLLIESRMNFDQAQSAPHDRSIFRKNIGRALLNNDPYLDTWEIDFTASEKKKRYGHLRDIEKEKEIEYKITKILRDKFSFRYLPIQNQEERLGTKGLERSLIGTVSHCLLCKPSPNWLGKLPPIEIIRNSGLWQVPHLNSDSITNEEKARILKAISSQKKSINLE